MILSGGIAQLGARTKTTSKCCFCVSGEVLLISEESESFLREFTKRMTEATIREQEAPAKLGLYLPLNKDGGIAQLGEHLLCKQGVRSSILLISTKMTSLRIVIKHCK